MAELIASGRRIGLGIYGGMVGLWCELSAAMRRVLREIDRDTRENPGLICALAGVAILIAWLAVG